MKTILITGAYGFVGTNLAKSFRGKYHLWALDVSETEPGLYQRFYDWNDLEQIPLTEVDTVIHLAGKAHDTKNESEAQVYFEVNTGLTQTIFDYFLKSGARNFIFFSSVKAAADTVETEILTEDIIPKPVGPYGESKIQAEEYLRSREWGEKRVYIFRPAMIHGPGNKGNLNLLYGWIKKRIPYPLGCYDNKRSFASIQNLCFLIDRMMEVSSVPSGIYNIADDEPVSIKELIGLISLSLGRKPIIWHFPKGLIRFGARTGDVLHLPLNSERLKKLTETYVVDNRKIKKALKLDRLPVASSDSLLITLRSFTS